MTALAYRDTVASFRHLTSGTTISGRCCIQVDRRGTPACCWGIAEGTTPVQFSAAEALYLHELYGVPLDTFELAHTSVGPVAFLRPNLPVEPLRDAVRDGWIANSLECGSHPTRPIIGASGVIGVAVRNECNAMYGMAHYQANRDRLLELWQAALDLCGPKPYYLAGPIGPGFYLL